MIKTKKDLKEYMEADRKQLGVNRKYPRPFTDEIWRYEIYLRKYEYYLNTQKKILSIWYKIVLHKLGVKLGIGIAPNVCGKGLSIAHYGCIEIHEGVTVGASGGDAPVIGNNVFLGTGCKVIGAISIANDVTIGANAVVVKSILEAGVTYAGVPAVKVSDNNSYQYVFWMK